MIGGGGSKNNEVKSNDNIERKSFVPEQYQELEKVAHKLNDMFFADDGRSEKKETDSKDASNDSKDTFAKREAKDTSEASMKDSSDNLPSNIAELMSNLFVDDMFQDASVTKDKSEIDSLESSGNIESKELKEADEHSGAVEKNESKDSKETNVERKDPVIEKIHQSLSTPEGIKALIEKHPEKEELWKDQLEAIDALNDPEASPTEIRSAQAKLSILKGQLLETAVKDALSEAGFDVETQQRVVEGESGATRPDAIAKNNTDHPIEIFGITIQSGEMLSIECKCGGSVYMADQLNKHIPNQLSGQEGTKVLLTTSDIRDTPAGLANSVCEKYGAKLVVADVSVAVVENAIKEVAES